MRLGLRLAEFPRNILPSSQTNCGPSSDDAQQDSLQPVPTFDCTHDEKHASPLSEALQLLEPGASHRAVPSSHVVASRAWNGIQTRSDSECDVQRMPSVS